MQKRVLVVGDALIDRYLHVKTDRMSAEGAGPVYEVDHVEERPGGAANVAANLKAVGSEFDVWLSGVGSGSCFPIVPGVNRLIAGLSSVVKNRWVHDGRYVMRVDDPCEFDASEVERYEDLFVNRWDDGLLLNKFDAFVVSDYDIGTVTEAIAKKICSSGKLVVVDSKRQDLSRFRCCSFLKLNLHEFAAQRGNASYLCPEELAARGVVLTSGKDGASIRRFQRVDRRSYRIDEIRRSTIKAEAVDVTGCGDTFVAAFVVSLLRGSDEVTALDFANSMAAKAVGRFGTVVVNSSDS